MKDLSRRTRSATMFLEDNTAEKSTELPLFTFDATPMMGVILAHLGRLAHWRCRGAWRRPADMRIWHAVDNCYSCFYKHHQTIIHPVQEWSLFLGTFREFFSPFIFFIVVSVLVIFWCAQPSATATLSYCNKPNRSCLQAGATFSP